jgi:uncharacterized glyoxalase superfamily protein PhnB
LVPHLALKDCARAIDFYKQAFGAKESLRIAMPNGKIIHADLTIGDSHFFVMDEPPGVVGAGGRPRPHVVARARRDLRTRYQGARAGEDAAARQVLGGIVTDSSSIRSGIRGRSQSTSKTCPPKR